MLTDRIENQTVLQALNEFKINLYNSKGLHGIFKGTASV